MAKLKGTWHLVNNNCSVSPNSFLVFYPLAPTDQTYMVGPELRPWLQAADMGEGRASHFLYVALCCGISVPRPTQPHRPVGLQPQQMPGLPAGQLASPAFNLFGE